MNPENKENINPNIISQYLRSPPKVKHQSSHTPEFSIVPHKDDYELPAYISDLSSFSFREINPFTDELLKLESKRELTIMGTYNDSLRNTCHCHNGRNSELEKGYSQLQKDYSELQIKNSFLQKDYD
jgi:hypothetical protein